MYKKIEPKCEKCGSTLFYADDATTVLFYKGEVVTRYSDVSEYINYNCIKCNQDKEEYKDRLKDAKLVIKNKLF